MKGMNHIIIKKELVLLNNKDLLLKYKEILEIKYPHTPPEMHTNKVIIFIKKFKQIKGGVGNINHINIDPLIIDIKTRGNILYNINQLSSFKG